MTKVVIKKCADCAGSLPLGGLCFPLCFPLCFSNGHAVNEEQVNKNIQLGKTINKSKQIEEQDSI